MLPVRILKILQWGPADTFLSYGPIASPRGIRTRISKKTYSKFGISRRSPDPRPPPPPLDPPTCKYATPVRELHG